MSREHRGRASVVAWVLMTGSVVGCGVVDYVVEPAGANMDLVPPMDMSQTGLPTESSGGTDGLEDGTSTSSSGGLEPGASSTGCVIDAGCDEQGEEDEGGDDQAPELDPCDDDCDAICEMDCEDDDEECEDQCDALCDDDRCDDDEDDDP